VPKKSAIGGDGTCQTSDWWNPRSHTEAVEIGATEEVPLPLARILLARRGASMTGKTDQAAEEDLRRLCVAGPRTIDWIAVGA
jgi:hypothetical protein